MSGALGDLNINLSANTASFQSAMSRAEYIANQSLGKIADSSAAASRALDDMARRGEAAEKVLTFGAIGAAAWGAFDTLKEKVESSIGSMGKLKDISEITGMSVEGLSKIASIAKLSGNSIEDISSAITKMDRSLSMADKETSGFSNALKAMGINVKEFKALNPYKQFELIAKKQAEFSDGAGKSAAMMAIFGKSGAQIIPVLNDLAEAGDIQAKVTTAQGDAADHFEKTMVKVNAINDLAFKKFTGDIIPALEEVAGKYLDNKEKISEYATSAAKATASIINHSDAIWAAAKAYAVLKSASMAGEMLTPVVNSLVAGTKATYENVTATKALSLAEQEKAAVDVTVLATKKEKIAYEIADRTAKLETAVAAREAAVAELSSAASQAAAGSQRLAILNGVISANVAAEKAKSALTKTEATQTAITAALTAAQGRQALAINGISVATKIADAATKAWSVSLAALGGPVGAVITGLTVGATAWQLFGSKAEESLENIRRKTEQLKGSKAGMYRAELLDDIEPIRKYEKEVQRLDKLLSTTPTTPTFSKIRSGYEEDLHEAQTKLGAYYEKREVIDQKIKELEGGNESHDSKKGDMNFGIPTPARKDPFVADLSSMGQHAAKLQNEIELWDKFHGKVDQSASAMLEFDLAYGKFSPAMRKLEKFDPLTDGQVKMLRDRAAVLDESSKKIASLKFLDEQEKTQKTNDIDISKRNAELDYFTETAYVQQQIKNIEDQRAKAQEAINKAIADGNQLTEEKKNEIFSMYDGYAEKLNKVEERRRALERDPFASSAKTLGDYADAAGNLGAKISGSLTRAFDQATDALTNFVMTGKADFSSLTKSILTDMAKIAIQKGITSPFSGWVGGLIGAGASAAIGGGIGGAGGGVDYSLSSSGGGSGLGLKMPSFDIGTNDVPQDMVAMIHKGEMIVPKEFNPSTSGMSGGDTHNIGITINHNGESDVTSSTKMQAMAQLINAAVQQKLIEQKRPGGLLAA